MGFNFQVIKPRQGAIQWSKCIVNKEVAFTIVVD
jgi:hypothetical protein